MTYRITCKNTKTGDGWVMGEVRGLEDVADAIKNIAFDDSDNTEEWSFTISPISSKRQRIDALKERIEPLRCYDKLLDAIGECIYNFADVYAEEFDATVDELMVVAEEMVYKHTIDDEELEERLMEE